MEIIIKASPKEIAELLMEVEAQLENSSSVENQNATKYKQSEMERKMAENFKEFGGDQPLRYQLR